MRFPRLRFHDTVTVTPPKMPDILRRRLIPECLGPVRFPSGSIGFVWALRWLSLWLAWEAGLGFAAAPEPAASSRLTPTVGLGAGKNAAKSASDHWAFQPLSSRPARGRGTTTLDSFWSPEIRAASSATPSTPVSIASREVLIRRVSYGLTGLPPSPEAITAFVQDPAPDAYERLVESLLASRHFGERWGRHWLDLARYADSNGYEDDDDRAWAWPYRDWVIRAINADLPFDTFTKWQLAGDEYAPANPDAVIATGFITAALSDRYPPTITEENKLVYRYNELDDMVSTTGSAFLALTLGCARCHDHKFDPLPTEDYYRVLAAFSTGRRTEASLSKPVREFAAWKAAKKRAYREEKMAGLGLKENEKIRVRHSEFDAVFDANDLIRKHGEALDPKDEQLRAWLPPADQANWTALETAAAASAATSPRNDLPQRALMFTDTQETPVAEFLLRRGSVQDRTQPVTLGFLQVLMQQRTADDFWNSARPIPDRAAVMVDAAGWVLPPTTFQRKAMAEWITDVDHGAGRLLARVIVNRLWQHHFGEGLVRTASDFGTQGDAPLNPEQLDWLASELIRQGWRLKPIHRLILLSHLYRSPSDSRFRVAAPVVDVAKDPKNDSSLSPRVFIRHPTRNEAETLRDAVLAVSGKLNRKMFGPPFRLIIPKEAMATRSRSPYPTDLKETTETSRRSIYAFVKRSVRNPMMEVFDSPDPSSSCGRRNTTTVPTQALTLLNDDFIRQSAVQFAQRVIAEVGLQPEAQLRRAYLLALGRAPSRTEIESGLRFLAGASDANPETIPVNGLTDLCHVLFTLNEFVYVE